MNMKLSSNSKESKVIAHNVSVLKGEQLGDESFKTTYGTKYAYYAGAMANGISSVEMVIALGQAGFMGSFGSGGLSLEKIEEEITRIQDALNGLPFMINMLADIANPDRELKLAQLLVRKKVTVVEAAAYINESSALAYYRLKGAHKDKDGKIVALNHIIAKVSREEVATTFLLPISQKIIDYLLQEGLITSNEAECAPLLPFASDITVEADSAGHTDNRPLVSLLPAMIALRDELQEKESYRTRIGAAGGIATGSSALAAFTMGGAYVATGSINQSCIEAGTSTYVKELLCKAKMAETAMAPSADMFEVGGKVQVLKTQNMFAQNAQKLYKIYCTYHSLEEISEKERSQIEKRIFKNSIENIWKMTEEFFSRTNPFQLEIAKTNPKIKMAMCFRWYLGNSSKWAVNDVIERRMDMQIWCGQAMGTFNLWTRGTQFDNPSKRSVAAVAKYIMDDAAQNMSNLIDNYNSK